MIDEQKLKLALARMLPEKIEVHDYSSQISHPCFMWNQSTIECGQIKDTEWLHICWLIEQGMSTDEHHLYRIRLWDITCDEESNEQWNRNYSSPSWPQRAIAICKVKGVEV